METDGFAPATTHSEVKPTSWLHSVERVPDLSIGKDFTVSWRTGIDVLELQGIWSADRQGSINRVFWSRQVSLDSIVESEPQDRNLNDNLTISGITVQLVKCYIYQGKWTIKTHYKPVPTFQLSPFTRWSTGGISLPPARPGVESARIAGPSTSPLVVRMTSRSNAITTAFSRCNVMIIMWYYDLFGYGSAIRDIEIQYRDSFNVMLWE